MTFAGRLGRQRHQQTRGRGSKQLAAEPSVLPQGAASNDSGRWANAVRMPRWAFGRAANGGGGSGAHQQAESAQTLTTAGPPTASVADKQQSRTLCRAARSARKSRFGLWLPAWFSSNHELSKTSEAMFPLPRQQGRADEPSAARTPEEKDPLHAQSCALLEEVKAAGTEKDACLWRLVSLMYEQNLNDDELASLLQSCPEVRWIAQCASRTPLPPGWRKDLALRIFVCEATGTVSATPPNIAQFVQLARLVLHARRAPHEALVARKWVENMMQEAIQQAGRITEEWTGPHVDAESGAEYYHCPSTRMSCWENPSAGNAFLACVAHRLLQSEAFPDDAQRSLMPGPHQQPNAETLFLAGLAAHLLHRDSAQTGHAGIVQHQGTAMRLQPLEAAAERAARRSSDAAEPGSADATSIALTQAPAEAHFSRTTLAAVSPGEQIETDSTESQEDCQSATSPALEEVEQLLKNAEERQEDRRQKEEEEHNLRRRNEEDQNRRRRAEEDEQRRQRREREEDERRRRRREEEEERSRRKSLDQELEHREELGSGEEVGSTLSTFGLPLESGEAKSAALVEEDHASCWSFGDNNDVERADVPASSSGVDEDDLMHLKSLLAPPVGTHGDTIESILAELADDLSEASDLGVDKTKKQQQQRHAAEEIPPAPTAAQIVSAPLPALSPAPQPTSPTSQTPRAPRHVTFAESVEAEGSETAPHASAAPSEPCDVAAGAPSLSSLSSAPPASRLAPLPFTPVVRAESTPVGKLPSMESIMKGGSIGSLADTLAKPATVKVERWPCSTPFSTKRPSAPTKLAAMLPSNASTPVAGSSIGSTGAAEAARPRASPAGPGWQPPPHMPVEGHGSPSGRALAIKRALKGGPSMLAPPPGSRRRGDDT